MKELLMILILINLLFDKGNKLLKEFNIDFNVILTLISLIIALISLFVSYYSAKKAKESYELAEKVAMEEKLLQKKINEPIFSINSAERYQIGKDNTKTNFLYLINNSSVNASNITFRLSIENEINDQLYLINAIDSENLITMNIPLIKGGEVKAIPNVIKYEDGEKGEHLLNLFNELSKHKREGIVLKVHLTYFSFYENKFVSLNNLVTFECHYRSVRFYENDDLILRSVNQVLKNY